MSAKPTRRKVGSAKVVRRVVAGPVRWIVGVGASTGGLDAFSQLLEGLPTDTGMAFVFVQHLAPHHDSILTELLAARTSMPVVQARNGMALRANQVFVIPPNVELTLARGKLRLAPRPAGRARHLPINAFFRSLSRRTEGNCIGVVLSGAAADGAIGLRELKAVGGITIAQDPATAGCDAMPRAAIATDAVDLVLAPKAIAVEIGRIAKLPAAVAGQRKPPRSLVEEGDRGALAAVFQLLRAHSGVDFSQYKSSTVLRRLHRRMVLRRTASLARYLRLLHERPEEIGDLFNDLLIHVTSFFRDPPAFEQLRREVLPRLLRQRASEAPLRIWVPGCSTGEEAYSVAICLIEAMQALRKSVPVRIFATDVSEAAIQHARAGAYSAGISADVSPRRLARHFARVEGSYKVEKAVRDRVIFARHDVTRDPPFSRLDLVVCRNLLIYLDAPLQRRLLASFHYAIRPGGFLLLGAAESTGSQVGQFGVFDFANRVYVRRPAAGFNGTTGRVAAHSIRRESLEEEPFAAVPDPSSLSQQAGEMLLARDARAGVIVDRDLRIVHFRGQTGAYLESPTGDANMHLLKMVRGGLLRGTRAAVDAARQKGKPAERVAMLLEAGARPRRIVVVVLPMTPAGPDRHYFVLFEEAAAKSGAAPRRQRPVDVTSAELVTQLRHELAASRNYLQTVHQDFEAANEELQSANEEILSNNEELQSANEELDTAKEEMQSTNEELHTMNAELRERNAELAATARELAELSARTNSAAVIVDGDLRIRRTTAPALRLLGLVPGDVGRLLAEAVAPLGLAELGGWLRGVVERATVLERDVPIDGRTVALRIDPRRGPEGIVDGAIATFGEPPLPPPPPARAADGELRVGAQE